MRVRIVGPLIAGLILVSCQATTGKEETTYQPIGTERFKVLNLESLNNEVIVDTVPKPSFTIINPQNSVVDPRPRLVVKSISRPVVPVVRGDPKAYARKVLGPTQYACIDKIFTHESHWNYKALNKSSGAYGIPQALPGSKMAWAGSDWKTNPITQVKWGIHYVKGRYGSACAAWRFWQSHRWY